MKIIAKYFGMLKIIPIFAASFTIERRAKGTKIWRDQRILTVKT